MDDYLASKNCKVISIVNVELGYRSCLVCLELVRGSLSGSISQPMRWYVRMYALGMSFVMLNFPGVRFRNIACHGNFGKYN